MLYHVLFTTFYGVLTICQMVYPKCHVSYLNIVRDSLPIFGKVYDFQGDTLLN